MIQRHAMSFRVPQMSSPGNTYEFLIGTGTTNSSFVRSMVDMRPVNNMNMSIERWDPEYGSVVSAYNLFSVDSMFVLALFDVESDDTLYDPADPEYTTATGGVKFVFTRSGHPISGAEFIYDYDGTGLWVSPPIAVTDPMVVDPSTGTWSMA